MIWGLWKSVPFCLKQTKGVFALKVIQISSNIAIRVGRAHIVIHPLHTQAGSLERNSVSGSLTDFNF